MQKLRLINWHYYSDETIPFGRQTVISGHTGAGKSTIIDALQVLFITDERKIKFNSAAHEEAKRSLINYLRGKVGTTEKPFVRVGDFTSYITAEFYDDQTSETFVVGICINVFKDDSRVKEYFILPKTEIDVITFFIKNGEHRYVKQQEDFHKWVKQHISGAFIDKSQNNYQKQVLHRLGGLQERFTTTFSKALSFKPIDNIRNFVYDNILDKKELKLDVMKSIFRTHEDLQHELRELKQRKEKLEEIALIHKECIQLDDIISIQDYIIRGLNYLLVQEQRELIEGNIQQFKKDLQVCEENKTDITAKKKYAREMAEEYIVRIANHDIRKKQRSLTEQIGKGKDEHEKLRKKHEVYMQSLNREEGMLDTLNEYRGNAYFNISTQEKSVLQSGLECFSFLIQNEGSGGGNERTILYELQDCLSAIGNRLTESRERARVDYEQLENREQQLVNEIDGLKRKKRTYPSSVNVLKKLLTEHLGAEAKVWILCEELEIKNEEWRNAIEGYLNTQRFDILVEPKSFTKALSIYEAEKWKHSIEGVGLVDTEKEKMYFGKVTLHSLAEEIEGTNEVVLARVHHLLGQVMKAENEQQLRKFKTAVTPTCMSYQRLVARQIPKHVYQTPYIGARAIQRQLEMKEKELQDVQTKKQEISSYIQLFQEWTNKLKDKYRTYEVYIEHLSLHDIIVDLNKELEKLKEELNALNISDLKRLERDLEIWKGKYENLDQRESQLTKQEGILSERLKNERASLYLKRNEEAERLAEWEKWESKYRTELLQEAERRFEAAKGSKKAYGTLKSNYEGNKKGNESKYTDKRNQLVAARKSYNDYTSLHADVEAFTNNAYEETYERISNVDIPKFEKEIIEALKQAGEEFQSHFVYKMREAIQAAHREFRQLNYALGKFKFRNDMYRFEIKPNEQFRKFYDVIMDESLQAEASLFDFANDKGEVLNELFERLVQGEYGEQDEFVDYRNYLDFDLIIKNENGVKHISNLLREQSGGETQTPFYIAILASFQQLYTSSNAIRLVVFDEAFNKMDEERIQISLRLIKQLNLQLIAAVPDEKMAHMAPEVETVVIITRSEHTCFADTISRSREEESVGLQEQDSFVLTD